MRYLFPILIALIFVGCQKTKPQSPSNKYHKTDTIGIGVILLNQRLAEEADEQLRKYVLKNQLTDYVLSETGVWYKHEQLKTPRLEKYSQVTVNYSISTLQDSLLVDIEQDITVGKRETIAAIDDKLLEMGRGETITMLVPWHQAYGATGTQQVPAYTNTKIELKILL